MNYIHQHVADAETLRFLVSILADNFEDALDELFGVVSNYTVSSATVGEAVVGDIYMPAPRQFLLQSAGTTELNKDAGNVTMFVGPTSAARKIGGANTTVLDTGYIYQMEQDYAATLIFGVAPQKEVTLDGRKLREESILRIRANYYAGAIAHVIAKKGFGSVACRGTIPLARSTDQSEIRISADQYSLIAVAAYEFTVVTTQLFPFAG